MENYIENPKTGRMIRMDGATYQKLKQQKVKFNKKTIEKRKKRSEPRKISPHKAKISPSEVINRRTSGVRGWSDVKPGRSERHELKNKCGDKCFLDPKNEKYPICPKYSYGKCNIDCRGLLAAKIRASQWHQTKIADQANQLGKRLQCSWSK